MARDDDRQKDNKKRIVVEDESLMYSGNANTANDLKYGDFVYQQDIREDRVVNIKRPIIDEAEGKEQQNGTKPHDEDKLPSLEEKIREAEESRQAGGDSKKRSRDREERE